MRPLGGANTGRAARGFSLFVVVLLVLLLPPSGYSQMVGSVHDFTDDGFTGGGVCAACHVPHGAGASRLWPRSLAAGTDPVRLCMDCHDGVMPTGDGWPNEWLGNAPPPPGGHVSDQAGDHADLSCRDEGQQNCGACHLHQTAFAMVGGCFDCHTSVAEAEAVLGSGNALFPDDATGLCMQTDREFDGIGAIGNELLLSQHNVQDSAVDCQKCHGSGHPGDDGLLAYPDDVGTHVLGEAIPRSANMADYQEFCIACHDGVAASACGHAVVARDAEFLVVGHVR
ncbi:MAG: hypothetical protein IH608_09695, partial [Proteobacteria bacterium]|nr:hypothetical protein [Pseudomonadota bacterium]